MDRRYKDMCKYANNEIVKVSTVSQVNTIKRVLASKTENARFSVPKADFEGKLWVKNDPGNSIIKK